jgi:hypothetical protein
MPAPSFSPFDLVLGKITDLPDAFREQYLRDSGDYDVVLEGRMARVWSRPAWLRPLFSLFAMLDLIFPETGHDIPVKVTISNEKGHDGRTEQVWSRDFEFRRHRKFVARVAYDDKTGQICESFGPGGCIVSKWDIRLAGPDVIEIRTTSFALRVKNRLVPLPRLLTAEVIAVEKAIAAPDPTIYIDLLMTNALFGPIFGYEGEFKISRVYHPDRSVHRT